MNPLKRGSGFALLALALTGCATSRAGAGAGAGDPFAGDWYYGSECEFGHYTTLSLEPTEDGYAGDWTDGTRVGGGQGQLRAKRRDGVLEVQFCDEPEERGAWPACPNFVTQEDSFEREGDALVWYVNAGGGHRRYVTLWRAGLPVDLKAECPDEGNE